MMRNIRKIILAFILVTIILNFKQNSYAFDCNSSNQVNSTTYCNSNSNIPMPYSIYTSIGYTGESINLYYTDDNGNPYLSGEAMFFNMKANGRPAYCVDSNKSYPYGIRFKKGITSSSDFLKRLYNWGSNSSNYKKAQLIIWALANKGYFGSNEQANAGIQGYLSGQNGRAHFVNLTKSTLQFAGELGTGSFTLNADAYKWFVSENACKCIFDIYNQTWCGNNFNISYSTSTDKSIRYNNQVYSRIKRKSIRFDEQTSYNYLSTDFTTENAEMCFAIARKAILADKINTYRSYKDPSYGGSADHIVSGQINEIVGGIYDDIMNTPPVPYNLVIYNPAEEDYHGEAPQRIFAPEPGNLEPGDCSNMLGNLKKLNLSTAENIALLKNKLNIDIINDGNTLRCRSAGRDCGVFLTTQYYVTRRRVGYTPKLGTIWKYIYNPAGTSTSVIECNVCVSEKDKFIDKYGGDCDRFKAGIDDPQSVVSCTPHVDVHCTDGGPVGATCESLLDTARASRWTEQQFKDRLTDQTEKNKVTTNENGLLDCESSCKPEIIVHENEATCKSKGKNETFALSDSVKNDYTPDKAKCIYRNTGYRLKNDKVGSKDTFLSNSYCDVYCWESLSVILPTDPQVISSSYEKANSVAGAAKAGRLFFWGLDYSQGIFSQMNVKRICWTKPNYTAFEQDWNANETNIRNTYTEYTKYVAFRDSNDVQTDNRCIFREGDRVEYDTPRGLAPESGCTCDDSNPISLDDMCHCTRPGNPTYGTRYSRDVNGIHGETECYENAQSNPDDILDHLYDNKIEELRNTINGLIEERNNKYNAINSCQKKKSKDQLYRAKPVTKLQRTIYNPNETVEIKTGELMEISNISSDTTARRNYNCTVIGPEFGVGPCVNNAISIKDFSASEFEWNFEGQYNFYYTKDFHHWIIQPEGKMVQENTSEYKEHEEKIKVLTDNGLAFDVGVGFKTKMTTSWGFLHVQVYMKNLGTCIDDNCTKFHFDKIMENAKKILDLDEIKEDDERNSDGQNGVSYNCAVPFTNEINESECIYYIDNNGEMKPASSKLPKHCPKNTDVDGGDGPIDCTDCDLDIVYRLIDMGSGDNKKSKEEIKKDIFPGAEGKGRELGTNWESLYENGYEKFKYITTYDKIYDSTPIYSIDLTPSVITEIRKDNNNYRRSSNTGGSKDPYTSYYDADNKLKITCNTERGVNHTCVSDFITEYIQKDVIKGDLAKKDPTKRISYIKNYKCYYDTGKLDTACSNNIVY